MSQLNVRKRNNLWQYRFETASVDGKRKQKSKGGFRTKAEALAAGTKALAEYNAGGLTFEPTEMSVADYLDYWQNQYVKKNLAYNTQLGYMGVIENHLKPQFGQYKLKNLQASIVQEYLENLKLQGFSKSSIGGILTIFQTAVDYARVPCSFIKENPLRDVRMPKVERKPRERIILTAQEWKNILERFPEGNRFHIMLQIGYHTGMRISEVCALTWDDIDFQNNTIKINKQTVKRNFNLDVRKTYKLTGKKEKRSEWYFQKTKTMASTDTILMGETLKNILLKEKSRQAANELLYGEFWTEHHIRAELDEKNNQIYHILPVQKCAESSLPKVRLVCIDEDGSFTTSDSFKYCARIIHHELGLAFDFHALRHTHGTILAETGVNPKAIQKRLRHANISTTLNTYIHATKTIQMEAVDQWEDRIRGQK
jgi:integrase